MKYIYNIIIFSIPIGAAIYTGIYHLLWILVLSTFLIVAEKIDEKKTD